MSAPLACSALSDNHSADLPFDHAPARVLREAWETALERHRQRDTVATLQVEAAAYDALVDYVETNDLNCTDVDPRGGHDAGCGHSVCPTCGETLVLSVDGLGTMRAAGTLPAYVHTGFEAGAL